MSVQAYRYAPPIPLKVVDSDGKIILGGQAIEAGQQVFLRYGLMQKKILSKSSSRSGPIISSIRFQI